MESTSHHAPSQRTREQSRECPPSFLEDGSNGFSVVIDDPLQVGECFFEKSLRFTRTELQEIIFQLADGELRRRLEAVLATDGWEINSSAVPVAISNGFPISGARLVKGNHVRLR